ncbi:unnamed protein product [Alternaria alternata]
MHLVFRIEQCSIRAKISLHEPWSLQNLFVVTREIDNMGDVGSEVRSHFYKGMVHWNAGRRGTVWYSKAPAVSGAIPMTHITQYFHEHSGQLATVAFCLVVIWIILPMTLINYLTPFTSIFANKTLSCGDSFYGQPQNATAMLESTTCVIMVWAVRAQYTLLQGLVFTCWVVRTQYTTHCRIDNGKDKYGDDWEESFRSRTEEADDITATDMMQHKDDELEGFVDYDIRDMGKGLVKHPKEKPLPGSGQLLVLLLGNMASGFPNLMTPTSGQLTGTMGSIYSWSHRSPKHPETRRDVRYRDATTSRLSTLITPTKERYEPFQTFQLSSPVPQDEESFSSKLTPSKKSKKGEKTRARKALKVKIPDGKKNAVPSSML